MVKIAHSNGTGPSIREQAGIDPQEVRAQYCRGYWNQNLMAGKLVGRNKKCARRRIFYWVTGGNGGIQIFTTLLRNSNIYRLGFNNCSTKTSLILIPSQWDYGVRIPKRGVEADEHLIRVADFSLTSGCSLNGLTTARSA